MDRLGQSRTGTFSVKSWMRQHRAGVRKCGKYLGIALVAVVLLQLVYPHSRALPGTKVSGMAVGWQSTQSIQKKLDSAYSKATLSIKTDDKTVKTSYDEAGISIEGKKTAQAAASYGWGWRLLPFSSFFVASRDVPLQMNYDDDRLAYFAQQTSKSTYVAPVNATIAIKVSAVALVPSKPSKAYSKNAIITAAKNADHTPSTVASVSPVVKAAPRTDSEVKGVLQQAQKAVDTPLTLTFDNERKTVAKSEIATWIDFTEDATTKQLKLALKNDVVQKYLDTIQGKVYKAPGTTTVQMVDNQEVSRTLGATGRGIDNAKAISLITDALHAGKEVAVAVPIATLQPNIVYNRSYSKTSAGLQALLATLAGTNGFGISVIDPGRNITASVNGSKRFEAASTYKLFVAYAIFQQMNSGAMHWSDTIYNGQSADTCFDAMIVKSDNNCAIAFGNKIGWGNIDNMIHAIGFNGTTLSGATKYTNAADLASYLQRLQAGTLLNGSDTDRLVGAMKRQIYRAGIPAGTGLTVADKVGFVDDVIHDAGIVYGPNGPYIMVVMTSNSSWGAIANAARQINTFLN
jgi:beta-lactamase class A